VSEFQDKSDRQPIAPDHQLPAPPPSSKAWILWVTLLVVAAVVAFYFLHGRSSAKSAKPAGGAAAAGGGRRGGMTGPVPVTVATATQGNIGVYLDALGTVTPVYTATITPQAGGVVTDVKYREGQYVKKGDPLLEIDPRPYEATLLQAQGTLEKDTNVLAQAQMDRDRYKTAWARNAINKQTLDDQEKIVLQDQGTVKNDQGTVQFDKVQVGFCHIIAPITGRVGLRLVDPGNVVQSNSTTALAVITQEQPITAIFTVAEDSLGQVQTQIRQKKRLEVDAFDRAQQTKIAIGKLLTIDNQIDTTTGTVRMRALFDNKDDSLFPNQFVNTRLLVKTLEGVTLIPTSAIQHNGQTAFVYVIQNDTAQIRNIKTGVTDAGNTAVEGINPGDVLANSSFEKLQNNSKIVVSKKPAAAANASEGPAT
jgi:membrane fusion protein, multidrug efflux system